MIIVFQLLRPIVGIYGCKICRGEANICDSSELSTSFPLNQRVIVALTDPAEEDQACPHNPLGKMAYWSKFCHW